MTSDDYTLAEAVRLHKRPDQPLDELPYSPEFERICQLVGAGEDPAESRRGRDARWRVWQRTRWLRDNGHL